LYIISTTPPKETARSITKQTDSVLCYASFYSLFLLTLQEGYDKKRYFIRMRRFEMKSFLFVVAFVLLSVGVSSAGTTAPVSVAAPTMMPWGMVGTAVAMGASGLYFIFKRNK
jgi:hypothetical protein